MKYSKLYFCLIIFLGGLSSCCHQSKCEIISIHGNLIIQIKDSINRLEFKKVKKTKSINGLGVLFNIETNCQGGGSCKPGYGGSEDYIEQISVILEQDSKEIDITNQLDFIDNITNSDVEESKYEQYLCYKSIDLIINDLNKALKAEPNRDNNRNSQLDTGFDLNLIKFPVLFPKSILEKVKFGHQVILKLRLNDNRVMITKLKIDEDKN